MEAVILAGGLGTRLRSICPDRPKPMADVNGKPFLYYLLQYWKIQGVSHFILSVGYLYEQIIAYFGNHFEGIPIDYSIEPSPMGTGGGLLLALSYLQYRKHPILVLNGDTYFEVPLSELIHFQKEKGCACCLSLVSTEKNTRYGEITLLPSGQIKTLENTIKTSSCLINGGCYLIYPDRLKEYAPSGLNQPISLEVDLLRKLVSSKQSFGIAFNRYFLDIGIPEDYFKFLDK